MSFLIATPELISDAATDLTNIGSMIGSANSAVAAATTDVLPPIRADRQRVHQHSDAGRRVGGGADRGVAGARIGPDWLPWQRGYRGGELRREPTEQRAD